MARFPQIVKRHLQGRFLRLVATALVLTLCPALIGGRAKAQTTMAIDSLRGVPAINVVVEDLRDETPPGLTTQQINTDVELKLRLAGIKVDPGPSLPMLYVIIRSVRMESLDFYAFSIGINFMQQVVKPSVWEGAASTWFTVGIGYVQGRTAADVIRSRVKDEVDTFLNDYLTANPPEN